MNLSLDQLPTLNALLNLCAAVYLVGGRIAIARRRIGQHRALMVAAVVCSALFLTSYLVYHFSTHVVTPFAGTGVWRPIYYGLLISHSVFAAAVPILVVVTLWQAVRKRFEQHRAFARWTFPIWLYVSVTGVLVYLMLYHFFPGTA